MDNKENMNTITKQLLQNAEESQNLLETYTKQTKKTNSTETNTIPSRSTASEEKKESLEAIHTVSTCENGTSQVASSVKKNKYGKIFEKWSVSDIVFLAIITTITLLTGAVMPLLINVPLFGIIQLGLSLQYSIFITIALLKVRKTGAMLFMSVISGIVLVFMNPIMFLVLVLCGLICEGIAILISRGFKTTLACIVTAILYLPLSLPFLHIYYSVLFPKAEVGAAVAAMRVGNIWINLGMSVAVIALNALGALIGYFISKELSKFAFYKK